MDKRNSDSDNSSVASDSLASKNDENNSSSKSNDNETDKQRAGEKTQKKEGNDVKAVENSMQFNLEEILKLDPLPDISEVKQRNDFLFYRNPPYQTTRFLKINSFPFQNVDNESAGSKFTRWFKRDEALSSNVINGEPIPGVVKAGSITSSSSKYNLYLVRLSLDIERCI